MCRKRLPSRLSTQGWTVTILRSLAGEIAPATVLPSASSSRFFSRGVDQRALAGGGLVDRLLGADPHRVDRLRAVMQGDLVLGASARKNQVSKRLGAKVGVIQWAKGTMRSVAISRSSASTRSTMLASSLASLARQRSLDGLEVGGGDQRALAALARQQDAAFLERLAHAGDAEFQLAVGDLVGAAAARAQPGDRRRRPRACRRETPARRRRHRSGDGAPP